MNKEIDPIDKITLDSCNLDDGLHIRKVGRYNASEISWIAQEKKTPENFFDKDPFELQSAKRIMAGRILEKGWEDMLNSLGIKHEYNPKPHPVLKVDDFEIVCIPDFIFPTFVIETKFSANRNSWEYLLESYKYQLECEYQVCKRQVFLGRFYLERGNEFNLYLKKYEHSEKRWEEIKEIMRKFDSSLKNYISKYGTNKSGSQILEVPTSNKL